MTKPSDKTRARKARKMPGGQTKSSYKDYKTGKHHCSVCQRVMHGMPHGKTRGEMAKLSKTEKRPEALLAGTLCNLCRATAVEEAVKVKLGLKPLKDVALNYRRHVERLQGRLA